MRVDGPLDRSPDRELGRPPDRPPDRELGRQPDRKLDTAATGERIDALLDYFAGLPGPAGPRAQELVRLLAGMYGAGLERILDLAFQSGALSPPLLDALAEDSLVSSLLLVHGLHPYDVSTRVERALDRVRPYLGSHGGDVELLGVEDDTVRLRLVGSCGSCPSSTVTLELAVRDAIESAAPEIATIDCVGSGTPAATDASPALIPVDALRVRLSTSPATSTSPERSRASQASAPSSVPAGSWPSSSGGGRDIPEPGSEWLGGTRWEPVDLAALDDGRARAFRLGGVDVALCRIGSAAYAFRDCCAACGGGLGGASLERGLGSGGGRGGAPVVLTCPTCRAHFDVRAAGASLDGEGRHLDPLPLLAIDGAASVALPGPVTA